MNDERQVPAFSTNLERLKDVALEGSTKVPWRTVTFRLPPTQVHLNMYPTSARNTERVYLTQGNADTTMGLDKTCKYMTVGRGSHTPGTLATPRAELPDYRYCQGPPVHV